MTTQRPPPKIKDRPFNPYLHPITDASQALIDEVFNLVMSYEEQTNPRIRKRRKTDELKLYKAVLAITCDLTYGFLMGWRNPIAITRSSSRLSRTSRYKPCFYGEHVPKVLDYMSFQGLNLVIQRMGEVGRQTTITPSDRLITLILQHHLRADEIGHSIAVERIVLKRKKEDFWDGGGYLEYVDTNHTIAMRDEVDGINDWLANADLGLIKPATLKHHTHHLRTDLTRIFNYGRFDCGGRLFGGFWQSLRRDDRHENVLINGEVAVELDYGQTNPTLMYGLVNVKPPDQDLYNIDGFEKHRKTIKKVFNSRAFRSSPMTRMPKDSRYDLPNACDVQMILKAIDNTHPDLIPLFNVDNEEPPIGFSLMHQESLILIKAIRELMVNGVVALPIHDALLVPASKTALATDVMKDAFRTIGGTNCSISLK